MAYKPKNVAKFRDDSSSYPKGGRAMGRGPATVPGTTGSDDRESQLRDFLGDGDHPNVNEQRGPDFTIMDRGNDSLDPKKNPDHGKASYAYEKPTL